MERAVFKEWGECSALILCSASNGAHREVKEVTEVMGGDRGDGEHAPPLFPVGYTYQVAPRASQPTAAF